MTGRRAVKRLGRFSRLVNQRLGETGRDTLNEVNRKINQLIAGNSESFGRDKWQTPMRSINRGRGDCEDYAILKYAALRLIGFSPQRLRLAAVKFDGTDH
ncbi:MAG: transglutaminase-like cysteine peptidase, partial [Myxococcota bacterium]